MFTTEYYQTITDILNLVYEQEHEKIDFAGKKIADVVSVDGLVHVFGCGHSHMLSEEMFYRAGGLITINPIFEQSVMLHEGAIKSSHIERMSGYAEYVLERYEIQAKDVFLISSSSGINPFPIEMAEEAKKRGAFVIGITSGNYKNSPSRDARGIHLQDICDLYIDNHVPHGDAVVEVDDSGIKAGPVSSISCFFIANSMMLAACEELKKRGVKPPVFKSGNIEGGDKHNLQMLGTYMTRIKHL